MLEITITSSALILVISALRLIFGNNISRRMRYAMWGIVLLRLLVPIQFSQSPVSVLNIFPHDAQTQIQHSLSDGAVAGDDMISANGSNYINSNLNSASQPKSSVSPFTSTLSGNIFKNSNPLIMIWITGAIATALWFAAVNLIFYLRLRRQRRLIEVENCQLPVYAAPDLRSPCLFGMFRPAI